MIAAISLQRLAKEQGWQYRGEDCLCDSIATDSRRVKAGDVFVALSGDNFDAHTFVPQAVKDGAAAVVVSRPMNIDIGQLIVPDPRFALGIIARANRRQSTATVVGITGSAGKTTTKEMLASILRRAVGEEQVLVTEGNFNNEIGVPLTLLRLEQQHRFAVVEMGAANRGDIAYLMQFAEPDVGVLLNAKAVHLEGFGSCDAVAQTKFEIISKLTDGAFAVINSDTDYSAQWLCDAARQKIQTATYSTQTSDATLWVSDINDGFDASEFTLHHGHQCLAVRLPVSGRHNISNALAAATAALQLSLPLDLIVSGLEQFSAVDGRMKRYSTSQGVLVIDDSYNANPDAMCAAVDVLAKAPGRRIFVMGQMGELGKDELHYHAEVGRYAKSSNIDQFLTLGSLTQAAAQAYGEGAQHFLNHQQLITYLQGVLTVGDVVLIKGSRSSKMDIVVKGIIQ